LKPKPGHRPDGQKWKYHDEEGSKKVTIKAVSVADRDSQRPEIIKILQDQETLWPPGACNAGMTMWIQMRTWYPIH
jgi:hypothetical protein